MNNLREEILRSAKLQLQSKSEAIMLEINILLSKPDGIENLTDKIVDLISKLSTIEVALSQAHNLYVQTIGQRVEELTKLMENASNKEKE